MNSDILQQLAAQLKVPAEHVWSVLLKQVVLEGQQNLLIAQMIFLTSLMLGLALASWALIRKLRRYRYDDHVLPLVFSLVVLSVGLPIAYSLNVDAQMKLHNPEFYALQKISELVCH